MGVVAGLPSDFSYIAGGQFPRVARAVVDDDDDDGDDD